MRPVAVGEREGSSKVLGHRGTSRLDGADDGLVQSLLVGDLGFRVGGLVGWVGKEGGLGLGSRGLLLSEVRVVELLIDLREVKEGRGIWSVKLLVVQAASSPLSSLSHGHLSLSSCYVHSLVIPRLPWHLSAVFAILPLCHLFQLSFSTHLDARDVQFGASGNNVGLVHPSNGNSIDLERTSDQQQTRLELLEEDDSLSPESTGEQDQDGTRLDGRSESSTLGSLSSDLGLLDVLGRVESRGLVQSNGSLSTLLELLLLGLRSLLSLGSSGLSVGGSLVSTLLLVGLGGSRVI